VVGSKVQEDLDKFSCPFHAQPQSHLMARVRSKKHVPKTSKSKLKSANSLPGYQHCWCEGFNIGCGVVRAASTRSMHARKVRECKEHKYNAYCVNIVWNH